MQGSLVFSATMSNLTDTPFDLEFAVTNRCNIRCIHCDVWRSHEELSEMIQEELRIGEIEKIFSSYRGFNVIGITGGEPFLREGISEIINVIAKTQRKIKSLYITSNGQLTETILEKVKEILGNIESNDTSFDFTQLISIDGSKDLHDHVRGFAGAHDRAMETIRLLSDLRTAHQSFHLGTVTCCSPFNIDRFDEVINHISELKKEYDLEPSFCVWFEGQLYKNVGKCEDIKVEEFRKKLIALIPQIKSVVKTDSLLSTGRSIFYDLLGLWLENPSTQIVPCGAARIRYFLGATGDVYPCTIFNHKIGNLRDYDFDLNRLFQSNSRKQTRYLVEEERCPICCNTCETIPAMMTKPIHTVAQWLKSKL